MKLSKKAITALSFTIGASIFISTAFADAMLGSGYDRLKGSAKTTAAQMEKGLNNYTLESLLTLKDNNQVLLQMTDYKKIDTAKEATENRSVNQNPDGKTTTNYSYRDPQLSIYMNGSDNRYYVTEFPDNMERKVKAFTSPFNEKGAPEVEKIVDAVVGSLKDYVQVEEKADGGKVFSGSLSEAQVPAVVNAVSSFGIKQMIGDFSRSSREINNTKLPEIESDIFVKKVTGTAVENKAGILENVTGDIVLTGKDKNGAMHDLTLNVVVKLSDVGSTKIVLPDLTGANVEKVSQPGGLSSKHVGTYSNNIVIEKNGAFVKIGERRLEITSVSKDKVTGKYTETVKAGFEAEYPNPNKFTFEYNPSDRKPMATFTYTNEKGEQVNGAIHPNDAGKVYLELNLTPVGKDSYRSNSTPYFDGQLDRIFE